MRSTALALVLCSLSAFASPRVTLEDSTDTTYDFRAGSLLTVTTYNGSISVRGGDDNRVHVVAKKWARARTDEDARALMASLTIEAKPGRGGLVLRAPKPEEGVGRGTGVTFEITMPRSADLELVTTNGGISVDDVRGDDKLHTTNGNITVEHGAGSLDAETTNGTIRAELLDVTPSRPLRALTTNGNVTLELPANVGANVDASTTNGKISSDFPITTNDYNSEHRHLAGSMNGGGMELRARTTNGSIAIRKR